MFIDKDGEFPTFAELLFKAIHWFRITFTSEKIAIEVANSSVISLKKKKETVYGLGVLNGVLSTIDLEEIKQDIKAATKKYKDALKSHRYGQLNTFMQVTPEDVKDAMDPALKIILEQAQQIHQIIENYDELPLYVRGQVDGIIIGTLMTAATGGLKAKMPRIRVKLAKLKVKLKFKIGKINRIPEKVKANHIFSDKSGKFADTPINRKFIEKIANDKENFLGTDKYGKEWYSKTLNNNKQVYVYAQKGVIKGAGINETPRNLVKEKKLVK